MRFGKEETSTEDKRRRLRRLVPPWSFLTRLRRPYLFPCAGKDRGEKGRWVTVWCILHLNSGERLCFSLAFHSILTLRASWYVPPDTGVPNLQPVAVEYLPSIEGTLEIQMDVTFLRGPCRGGALLRPCFRRNLQQRAEQSPAPTGCIPKASPMRGRRSGAHCPAPPCRKGSRKTALPGFPAGRFGFGLIQKPRSVLCRRRRSGGRGRARRGSRSASSSAGTSCPLPRSRRRSGPGS